MANRRLIEENAQNWPEKLTLLAERHHEYARSLAPAGSAWERTVLEAPPPVLFYSTKSRLAEPAVHWVTRQSLETSWWLSPRSVEKIIDFSGGCETSF